MKRLVDLEQANLYLFDLLFRHQVFLEGVKAGMQQHFRQVLLKLYGEFAKYTGMTRYDNLDAFTKVELQHFIYRFKQAQTHVYNQYTQQLIDLLKNFLGADLDATTTIYAAVSAKETSQHSNAGVQEVADKAENLGATHKALWSKITNAVVPANGLTLSQMLVNFGNTMNGRIANRLSMGYANGESVKEAFAAIVGTSDTNFRDGLFSSFANQNDSIIATALQHVSSMAQASIATALYQQYQWVAILDSRTTLICRSRNGNVYTYGDGPLPPAHWNCRSKAISLAQGDELHDIPATYYDWLRTQPLAVLTSMLGATTALKIVAGDSSVKDISIADAVIPLTLADFRSKISTIVL